MQPGLTLADQNAPVVAHICGQLDGIPLALEMAAALTHTLPLEQIAQHLDDRFALLTHGSRTVLPRHQTLRAIIDWSYDLLSVPERTLLRRLAVAAQLAGMQSDVAAASGYAGESSAICRELGNKQEAALVLLMWGRVLAWRGDKEASQRVQAELIATFQENGDDFGLAMSLFLWGDALMTMGDFAGAHGQLASSASMLRSIREQRMSSYPMLSLARVACAEGDYDGALALAEACLTIRPPGRAS